jgi:hypothetical protein
MNTDRPRKNGDWIKGVIPAIVAGVVSAAMAWGIVVTRVDNIERAANLNQTGRIQQFHKTAELKEEIAVIRGSISANERETKQYRIDVKRRLEGIESDLKLLLRRSGRR